MKPNKMFELSIEDIEIIESALRAKAGRRGMRIMRGEDEEQLRKEMKQLNDLLGRLHEQKNWYRPKDDTYVGG